MQMYPGYQQPMFGATYQPRYQQQAAPVAQGALTYVTSREQAVVAQIPFDGNTYYFANTSNDEVYAKRFDPATGQSPLETYRKEAPAAAPAFAPLALVQQMGQQIQAMQEQLQALQPKTRKTASKEEDIG